MAEDFQVTAGVTAIRREPRDDAMMDSQLLAGEVFCVEDESEGWARGMSRHDGYRGYIDMAALSAPVLIPTHRVSAVRTYVFSEPDLKSPPRFLLSLNAKIAAGRREGKFIESQRQGWVFTGHLTALDASEPDWVAVAERFLHSPYLWGGKESLGLDCSGLIQVSMEAAGIRIPRDSGDQEAWAKERWSKVPVADSLAGLQRGDLVFWPGHVGIMTDAVHMLHANAFHMATALEPLHLAAARIARHHAPMSGIFRAPNARG
ncbi:NLP/P60 protein [Glycocaulis alkaliphilus]|uniref:NLP/P60 protein n=1 Tax=Glycocaulis alkaliphilus TaxID=1434191 RepID=A0A3T0E7M2_9PROT|nr:C40 family peptidase [Glycocaulis alkaliphilus]AZU03260.1 NLP/P60 protein [Glycocaulis alkaliphilus]GGB72235.1 peptidase P60 [Glycocaulis alkaliphilus]